MNSIIGTMLEKYDLDSKESYINALKEVVQEIALFALSKSDFFEYGAFYGGTALRIFYDLDRFSEDLDFSLVEKKQFDISKYFKILDDTFKMYGFSFVSQEKEKSVNSNIQSAFLKGNTLQHILLIGANDKLTNSIYKYETIKIKFEIDLNPPAYASFEYKYGLLPAPYQIRLYDKASLFAGKIHAVLCRTWKQRFKGRDLYDYVYYISTKTIPNMKHLKERLIESKKLDETDNFTYMMLLEMLLARFDEIDFSSAKDDVAKFIKDYSKLSLWSKEFFVSITKQFIGNL